MKIVIEIPHQRPATVEMWEDDSFTKECLRQACQGDNHWTLWTKADAEETFGEEMPTELAAIFAAGHAEAVEYGSYRTEFAARSDAPSEADFGWRHWVHDLHLGVCFDSFSEAREWVASWLQRGGHQSIKVRIALERLEEQWA